MGEKYVAFLRGINLGKRNIKMEDLRTVFEGLGLNDVASVIASGNVLFSTSSPPDAKQVSAALLAKFGFEVGVIIRSIKDLNNLILSTPFADYEASKDIKLYLTLGSEKIEARLKNITNQLGDYDLVRIDEMGYFTVAYRQPNGRFGAGLDKLERIFSDTIITTRNWNTIAKIVKKAEA